MVYIFTSSLRWKNNMLGQPNNKWRLKW
jgi:hypothetical protein